MGGARWRPAAPPRAGERIAVALSGGVDSAVAAWLLVQRGCDIVGVTTRNFCFSEAPFAGGSDARSCCSALAVEAARALCASLGVAHVVLDVADAFRAAVIDDFIVEYQGGRTPNPCVRCNQAVRFPAILRWAAQLGITRLATGHYARLVEDAQGAPHVACGADAAKDQSYFLAQVPPELLAQAVFPLGELTKPAVRAFARDAGLPMADTPESQEVCFLPDGDRRPLLGPGAGPGDIVDTSGCVLGTHPGLANFTVGQRHGLGLSGGPARYVVGLDAQRNRVVVGDERELGREWLECDGAYLRDPAAGSPGLRAKTRYRHAGAAVRAASCTNGRLRVWLAQPDRAPAPGQALVLYRDDVIVGGGRLLEVSCAS